MQNKEDSPGQVAKGIANGKGNMEGDPRLLDWSRAQTPRAQSLVYFQISREKGLSLAGKQSCGQEAGLGSRAGRSWNKAGELRDKNRMEQSKQL